MRVNEGRGKREVELGMRGEGRGKIQNRPLEEGQRVEG